MAPRTFHSEVDHSFSKDGMMAMLPDHYGNQWDKKGGKQYIN